MSNKHKDFTPKKMDTTRRVRKSKDVIVLSDDDELCALQDHKTTEYASPRKIEITSESDCDESKPEFYRGNHKLPIFSRESPNSREIFQVCLFGLDPSKAVQQKPLRIKETASFAVDQAAIHLQHPFDLDADDTPGSFTKKDFVRFYEVTAYPNEKTFVMSSEAHVVRDTKGRVMSATTNKRSSTGWVSQQANISKLYALFRCRAVHNKTKLAEGALFSRLINYIMPINEFNACNGKLKDMKNYQLLHPFILVHCYFNGDGSASIHGSAHGNAKNADHTAEFRPREHSLKLECREMAASDPRAPRIISQESTENVDLLDTITDCSTIRDAKQITNYRYVFFI